MLGATNISCDMLLKSARDNRTLGSLKFVFESTWYRPPGGHVLLPPGSHGSDSTQQSRTSSRVQSEGGCNGGTTDARRSCVLHLEASVKYFLQLPGAKSAPCSSPNTNGTCDSEGSCSNPPLSLALLPPPPPPLTFYVGPFLKENLAWRVHVAQRKLLLADGDGVRPAGRPGSV